MFSAVLAAIEYRLPLWYWTGEASFRHMLLDRMDTKTAQRVDGSPK